MTAEEIVSIHPCPHIRAKILRNIDTFNYPKNDMFSELGNLIFYGLKQWDLTAEGADFWLEVFSMTTKLYSEIKHLDLSMNTIEGKVRAQYPNAVCVSNLDAETRKPSSELCFIMCNETWDILSDYFYIPYDAWEDALNRINNQSKNTNKLC